MSVPPVSVVIVSRHRPDELRKCLRSLRFQTHRNFEVVVVADPTSLTAVKAVGLQDQVKAQLFDEANISAARNIGIGLAAGEVVAFIDDDAIAEPTWLSRLAAPFQTDDIAAAAGFVRSRNGLSYRWRGDHILPWGELRRFTADGSTIYGPEEAHPVLTIGANCAFRRAALVDIGGFDPNFRMGLDDADVNVSLSERGHRTAIIPDAQVQHVPAASAYRTSRQVPLSLEENGASFGWWFRKRDRPKAEFERIRTALRDGFLSFRLTRGDIEPRDMARLLAGLDRGFVKGQGREPVTREIPPAVASFRRFSPILNGPHTVLRGHFSAKNSLFSEARDLAKRGRVVTVFLFSRTALYHRRWFHPDGFWVQSGGVFGKSYRSDPLFRRFNYDARVKREVADLAQTRELSRV